MGNLYVFQISFWSLALLVHLVNPAFHREAQGIIHSTPIIFPGNKPGDIHCGKRD